MEIPIDRLDPDTLRGIIEEYVTREGTDYGHDLIPLERKVAQVRAQLERGEARILYDAGTETVTLAVREAPSGA